MSVFLQPTTSVCFIYLFLSIFVALKDIAHKLDLRLSTCMVVGKYPFERFRTILPSFHALADDMGILPLHSNFFLETYVSTFI